MDWMQPMRIFVAVVQNGSLSSAGRQLGLSPASVSRHIGALEESLGCRLINRTSRPAARSLRTDQSGMSAMPTPASVAVSSA